MSWTLDGLKLDQYAFAITTLGGRMGMAPMRGDNIVRPFNDGTIWVPKRYDQRILTLAMFVIGANQDGSIPTDPKAQLLENVSELRRAFTMGHSLKTLVVGAGEELTADYSGPHDILPLFGNTNTRQIGSEFDSASGIPALSKIVSWVSRSGSPTDGLQLTVYDGKLGVGNAVATSQVVAASEINASYPHSEVGWVLDQEVEVPAGATYSWALARTGALDGSHLYQAGATSLSPSDDTEFYIFNGTTWSLYFADTDLPQKLYSNDPVYTADVECVSQVDFETEAGATRAAFVAELVVPKVWFETVASYGDSDYEDRADGEEWDVEVIGEADVEKTLRIFLRATVGGSEDPTLTVDSTGASVVVNRTFANGEVAVIDVDTFSCEVDGSPATHQLAWTGGQGEVLRIPRGDQTLKFNHGGGAFDVKVEWKELYW